MVASRCSSGIGAATTRSLILTLSAARAGVDSESVNAVRNSTPRARRKGPFSMLLLLICRWGGCGASLAQACFSLSDIGSLFRQPVGLGRPVLLGEPRSITGVAARLASA